MSLRQKLDNRLNPVLVKEVRQAVRGKFFRFSFLLMLIVASVVASLLLTNLDPHGSELSSDSGATYFFGMLIVFAAASMVLVPLQANRSMAAERDDRTFDALLISGLRPAQIIQGKWLASGMLLLLFTSTLAPFLVVGFTLFGLDLLTGILQIIFTAAFAMTLSLFSIMLACGFKNKAIQSIALAFNALACVFAVIMWCSFNGFTLFSPFGSIPLSDLLITAGLVFVALNLFNLWGYGLTISMITHPEENRLFRVRIANLLIACFSVILSLTVWLVTGESEAVAVVVMNSYFGLLALNIPTLTESDHLGVRCRHQLGEGLWRKPMAWLFLPGGSTGGRLFLLQILLVTLPLAIPDNALLGSFGTGTRVNNDGLWACMAALLVLPSVALFPGFIASRPSCTPLRRNSMRILIPALLPFLFLLSVLFGVLSDWRDMSNGRTVFNAIYFIERNWNHFRNGEGYLLWGLIAGLAMVLHMSGLRNYKAQVKKHRHKLGTDSKQS
jgi:hypothetical protein